METMDDCKQNEEEMYQTDEVSSLRLDDFTIGDIGNEVGFPGDKFPASSS